MYLKLSMPFAGLEIEFTIWNTSLFSCEMYTIFTSMATYVEEVWLNGSQSE